MGTLATGAVLLGLSNQGYATDFTWTGATATWEAAANWGGAGFPQTFNDSALFGATGNTTPTISTIIPVGNVTFNAGAQAYTVTISAGSLNVGGTGIINNSAVIQTFSNATTVNLQNSATVTGAVTINNTAANSSVFASDTSSTGTAVINNNGTGSNASYAVNATAGSSVVNNNGTNTIIQFVGNATGGTSTLNNVSDTGAISFFTSSNAGKATITNTGAGSITFQDNSSAGQATINNTNASGQLNVTGSATLASAQVNNNGTVQIGTFGGNDTPTAGNATINNQGANSATFIQGNATAGKATIISSGAGSGVVLEDSATGGSATFINSGDNSGVFITGNATGGNAAFVNANATASVDISGINAAGTTAGSIAGNGSFILGAKNLAVGSNNTNTTFSGVISGGGGSLTKVGLGTLTLTGANTYTGNTVINGGALVVDGSIVSPLTTVNSQGTLGGHGVIGGNVVNNGTVAPGNTPNGLTVKGNYTQTASGNLRIDIGKNSTFSKLTVNGAANLAGDVTTVIAPDVKRKVGSTIRFLTAAGGITGRFDELDANLTGTIVKVGLKYDPNAVSVIFQQGAYSDLKGLTRNQKAVANALDNVAFSTTKNKVVNYLNEQQVSQLPHDLDLLAPEELAAIWQSGFGMANVQTANIQRRTDDLRSGANGFSAANLAVNGNSQGSFSGPLAFRTGAAGPTGDGKESKMVSNPVDNRFGAFLSGTGEWINVGDTDNARGYTMNTGGFTLGFDYKITDNFAVGINAGYAGTSADLNGGGRIFVNSGKLGLYATYFTGGFYVDTAVSGGYNSYDTRRHGLGGTARGDTDGGELNVLFATGYDFQIGGLKVGPTASFQYTYLGISSFQEDGSVAPLGVNSQGHESIRTAFGMRAVYDWKVGGILIRPEVRAAWQHEYGDAEYTVDSHFDGSRDFAVNGPAIGRDSLLLSAGVAVLWNERTSTFVYYDGTLGGTNYDSHAVTGGIRIAY